MIAYHYPVTILWPTEPLPMSATLNVMGRPKKNEPTAQLRIPESVVKRIRRVCTHLGVEPGDYIAQKLAAVLDKDEERMLKDIEKERAKADEAKE